MNINLTSTLSFGEHIIVNNCFQMCLTLNLGSSLKN